MLIYENPLQKETELQCVCDQIHSMIVTVDNYWFEAMKTWSFPSINQPVIAEISPEYIRVSTEGSSKYYDVMGVPQSVWIVSKNCSLNSASSFHQKILNQFGEAGTKQDPVTNTTTLVQWLNETWNQYQNYFYTFPLSWSKGEEVVFEKCILFETVNMDGENNCVPLFEFVIIKKC